VYEGDTTNRITIGRNMRWDAISSVVKNGILKLNLVQNRVISLYDTGNDFQFVRLGADGGLVSRIVGTGDNFKLIVQQHQQNECD
jgi:hypothetical protein